MKIKIELLLTILFTFILLTGCSYPDFGDVRGDGWWGVTSNPEHTKNVPMK